MIKNLLISAVVVFLAGTHVHADLVGFEDFDGGALNLSSTKNVFDYAAGGGSGNDVFGRVSPGFAGGTGAPEDVADDSVGVGGTGYSGGSQLPGDTLGIAGNTTGAFFAMNDANAVAVNNATWTFNISSAPGAIQNITIDLAAMGDFEASSIDGFLIEARIDAGAYTEIFEGRTDEDASKTYRPLDGGLVLAYEDPLELFIDGDATGTGTYLDKSDATTGDFDSYESTRLAGMSGNTLDIRVSWAGIPSGNEPRELTGS